MIGKNETDLSAENSPDATLVGRDMHGISPAAHERMLNKALADLRSDLEAKSSADRRADQAVLELMQAKIAEFERRLADPAAAFAEYTAKITQLEKLLEDTTGATADIGENRIKAAQAAAEAGDFSEADTIFAEVEALEAKAVKRASDAAFGRGLIAEEQVRWGDAADHFANAARLQPNYDTLIKAGTYLWRAGRHGDAIRVEEELVSLARAEFGDGSEKTAVALNNLAESYRAAGRYAEAEPLYREALKITRKTLGAGHPEYAIRLNNLALLLRDKGDYVGAEPLYREALEITRKTLGEGHPSYAIRLNNLAALLKAKGDYVGAEPLFREALEIDRKTLGEGHSDYAIDLNNLAGLLRAKGDYVGAEPLYRQAVAVMEAALGVEHPNTVTVRGNLERFFWRIRRRGGETAVPHVMRQSLSGWRFW